MRRVSSNPEETQLIASEFVRNTLPGTVLSLGWHSDSGSPAKSQVPLLPFSMSTEAGICPFFIWISIVSVKNGNWMRSALTSIGERAVFARLSGATNFQIACRLTR
jgi:hypothetical protein